MANSMLHDAAYRLLSVILLCGNINNSNLFLDPKIYPVVILLPFLLYLHHFLAGATLAVITVLVLSGSMGLSILFGGFQILIAYRLSARYVCERYVS